MVEVAIPIEHDLGQPRVERAACDQAPDFAGCIAVAGVPGQFLAQLGGQRRCRSQRPARALVLNDLGVHVAPTP